MITAPGTIRRSPLRAAPMVVLASMTLACSSGSEAPRVPLGQRVAVDSAKPIAPAAHAIIGPAAKAQLDSGNALYRKKLYAGALTHYRQASDLAPQHAAPFFGIYMVARATGNVAMADTALAAIRVRNGPLPPPSRSLHDSVFGRMQEISKRKGSA